MRIDVIARGTHSLTFERSFDTPKRNLSLESETNITGLGFVCEGLVDQ